MMSTLGATIRQYLCGARIIIWAPSELQACNGPSIVVDFYSK
jgi:hypothetical protein